VSIYAARVLDAWAPSTMTRAIRIERPPEITFVASQASRLILGGDLARPMTIASGPARPYLDFAAQRTASEFKRAFFGLAPGDTVQITAPRGHFLLHRERPAAMIASGIGVDARNPGPSTPLEIKVPKPADRGESRGGGFAGGNSLYLGSR
jgi:hypothetical protein